MLKAAMSNENSKMLYVVALMFFFAKHSDCFRWPSNQQSTSIINAKPGSDVSLPCEFILTGEEESAMQQFNLIYWTKEAPAGSQSWQGISVKTNLISNSKPTIIHHSKSRFAMKSKSLTIFDVEREDEGLYQCEIKSSFYTTPALVKLKITATKPSYDERNSPLSDGAAAGIGVGTTLLIVVCIAGVVAILYIFRRNRMRAAEEPTNVGIVTTAATGDDAAQAYVGPGFPDPAANIEAVTNQAYMEMDYVLQRANEHTLDTSH